MQTTKNNLVSLMLCRCHACNRQSHLVYSSVNLRSRVALIRRSGPLAIFPWESLSPINLVGTQSWKNTTSVRDPNDAVTSGKQNHFFIWPDLIKKLKGLEDSSRGAGARHRQTLSSQFVFLWSSFVLWAILNFRPEFLIPTSTFLFSLLKITWMKYHYNY